MIQRAYIFHLRARNLSPATVKATEEYVRPFIALHDPLTATRRDIETYLGDMSERCKPSTVWTAWRHLKGFFKWLHAEGDISVDPMVGVTKPIVPHQKLLFSLLTKFVHYSQRVVAKMQTHAMTMHFSQ